MPLLNALTLFYFLLARCAWDAAVDVLNLDYSLFLRSNIQLYLIESKQLAELAFSTQDDIKITWVTDAPLLCV